LHAGSFITIVETAMHRRLDEYKENAKHNQSTGKVSQSIHAFDHTTSEQSPASSTAAVRASKFVTSRFVESKMGVQSAIAEFLDGPEGPNNKKLVKNLFIFGVAVAVLYNWETVIGDFDEPPVA